MTLVRTQNNITAFNQYKEHLNRDLKLAEEAFYNQLFQDNKNSAIKCGDA